jgi:hypothetical protein
VSQKLAEPIPPTAAEGDGRVETRDMRELRPMPKRTKIVRRRRCMLCGRASCSAFPAYEYVEVPEE